MVPDVIGEGVSEQKNVMKAICEAKGSTFDGVDCVGELNDSEVTVRESYSNGGFPAVVALFLLLWCGIHRPGFPV